MSIWFVCCTIIRSVWRRQANLKSVCSVANAQSRPFLCRPDFFALSLAEMRWNAAEWRNNENGAISDFRAIISLPFRQVLALGNALSTPATRQLICLNANMLILLPITLNANGRYTHKLRQSLQVKQKSTEIGK